MSESNVVAFPVKPKFPDDGFPCPAPCRHLRVSPGNGTIGGATCDDCGERLTARQWLYRMFDVDSIVPWIR